MPAPLALLILTPDDTKGMDGARSSSTAEALSVGLPLAPQALNVTRIPVYDGSAQITYLKGATWAETPAALFKALLIETLTTRTSRLVLDPREAPVAAGLTLSGRLVRFGVNAQTGQVVVTYDGVLSRAGGKTIAAHRFEAMAPVSVVDGTSVGRALNTAANSVAGQVAEWVRAN
jgi:cholesterol transport system auxiliary component